MISNITRKICETRKGPNRPRQDFGHFWPTSGGRNCQKAHLHTKTFHLSLFTCRYDHRLQRNSLEKLIFWKTASAVFGHFRPISVITGSRTCQNAYLQAKTVHISLFLGLYDHCLLRNSLENLCLEKPLFLDILAYFGHFWWPNLAETVKRHIYRSRPFIWAYSQVSTTIRYKDTAWKRIDDGRTYWRTDTPNL